MGLVHALRSSAEAALGDDDGPLRLRAPRDGVAGAGAARRSLALLEMLQTKTLGNLDATERDALWSALRAVRARLAPHDAAAPTSADAGRPGEPGGDAVGGVDGVELPVGSVEDEAP